MNTKFFISPTAMIPKIFHDLDLTILPVPTMPCHLGGRLGLTAATAGLDLSVKLLPVGGSATGNKIGQNPLLLLHLPTSSRGKSDSTLAIHKKQETIKPLTPQTGHCLVDYTRYRMGDDNLKATPRALFTAIRAATQDADAIMWDVQLLRISQLAEKEIVPVMIACVLFRILLWLSPTLRIIL